MERSKWVLWYAAALHLWWGGLLLLSAAPLNVTGIHEIAIVLPNATVLGVLFLSVGLAAAYHLGVGFKNYYLGLVILGLQEFLLLWSAGGAVRAMALSQFADGVLRPRAFLLADQIHVVLIALVHLIALFEMYGGNAAVKFLWNYGQRRFLALWQSRWR